MQKLNIFPIQLNGTAYRENLHLSVQHQGPVQDSPLNGADQCPSVKELECSHTLKVALIEVT